VERIPSAAASRFIKAEQGKRPALSTTPTMKPARLGVVSSRAATRPVPPPSRNLSSPKPQVRRNRAQRLSMSQCVRVRPVAGGPNHILVFLVRTDYG